MVYISFGEIQFALNTVPRVAIHDKEKTVESSVEDQGAIGRNFGLVKPLVLPKLIELAHMRLEERPVLEDALSEFLLVSVIPRANKNTILSVSELKV